MNREEIRRRREAKGMTQGEAAIKAGWGKTGFVRWSRLERGTPKDPAWSTMEAVAKVLRCKLDDLLSVTPKTKRKR